MNYKIISELTLPSGETEKVDHEFTAKSQALDFYRNSLSVMAEDISDYNGAYTATMYKIDEDVNYVIIKRHCISTTLNILTDGNQ